MTQIRSKILNRGNSDESSWPSEYGEGEKGLFVIRDGKAVRCERIYNAPEPTAPMIISDTIRHEVHPLTGKATDSRSSHRKMTREHNNVHGTAYDYRGAERVADNVPKFKEMGTDDYEKEVAIAREQVISGTAPLSDYDKHVCKEINQRLENKV